MKKFLLFIVAVLLVITVSTIFLQIQSKKTQHTQTVTQSPKSLIETNTNTKTDASQTQIIAENLDTPWAIAFLPTNDFLVTERKGTVRIVSNGILHPEPVATLSKVKEIGEGGLLGIALHPKFATNKYVYLYYTYSSNGSNTLNRVVRMKYDNNQLSDEKIIVDAIPGASNHNGGRIKFGTDKLLYIGTGDAENPSQAQDTKTLGGKILRVTDEGKPAPGNPFGNQVFSYGHRNVQGLTWDNQGNLWATEHGRSGLQSGLDEINLIQAGKNYGWPTIQGDETKAGMETPRKNSGNTTWAPSGIAFVNNTLFFSGLRGQSLYKAGIENNQIPQVQSYFSGEYGRIREVILGPDGMLYITTSNKDGRGIAQNGDDKIIKVNPTKL